MRKYFESASSTERRFLTGTFLILFLALNWIFVWPLFSDWTKFELRRAKAQRTLKLFENAIALAVTLKPKVEALEGAGSAVLAEDQMVKFMSTITSQAAASGVTIQNSVPGQARTNQFFVEQARALTLTAEEGPLVDFLYKLGTGESLVRVRGLSLRPDPPHHLLTANLTLVASYQKKAPAPAATPSAVATPASTPKPAAAAADKPKSPPPQKPAATATEKSKTNPPAKSDKPGVPKPSTPNKK